MSSLLDVNVLIALIDRDHHFHTKARRWFADHADDGWASCAITQNGFVRIVSQSAYPNTMSPSRACAVLRSAATSPYHQFWQDSVSLLDESIFQHDRIYTAKQVTDTYLLGLAVENNGRLITFDQRIATSCHVSATENNLIVLN